MFKKEDKNQLRKAKHDRIRFTLTGTADKPRLNVYRSTTNIYAQIIDDTAGKTLCSANSLDRDIASKYSDKDKKTQAYAVGEAVAKKALKLGIKEVVFDRGGYIYTGRVEQLAEGARSAGLQF